MFVCPPGKILIEPFQDDSTLKSTDLNYNRIGRIIALSSDSDASDLPLSVGDVIFFDDYAYRRFTYEGKDYCIIDVREGAVWGIICPHDTERKPLQENWLPPQVGPSTSITSNERPL